MKLRRVPARNVTT